MPDQDRAEAGSPPPRLNLFDEAPDPGPVTPVQRGPRGIWLKRDDFYCVYGAPGGKARTCLAILEREGRSPAVTASSRHSPQAIIVARIAQGLGLACRVHVPWAQQPSDELEAAERAGAEIIRHRPGYNSVIVSRANEDVRRGGGTLVPFGMECEEAVAQTSAQARATPLPIGVRRVVIAVGSGMTAAGLLRGLPPELPIIGVQVGADPRKRLDRYAPGWEHRLTLLKPPVGYHARVAARLNGVLLDPVYEAKAVPYLHPGDLFWIVGIRATLLEAA